MDEIKAMLEKIEAMVDDINVDAVFGKPETVGERVLIPVAEISYGFGAGFGGGPACCCDECCGENTGGECACHEADEAHPCCQDETGVAGGGGAGGRARPIAYIEVGPDGTKVEPIVDEQKIALGGMLLGAWVIAWVALVLKTLFRALTPRD
ncbi:MAG TPA: spore germination protein GerW family protein [Anaerolineae bacterium]|nr:spore germination protein GerW family protein [Anaerolineae bacterium]HQK12323.1 spore germination protein GerW family protein [Anaerolineae bacterium]